MPVGSQSTPRAQVSVALQFVPLLAPRFVGSFHELTAAPPVGVMSSTATSLCVAPPTEEKLPMITAWVCCGLTAIWATLVVTLVVTTPDTPSWVPVRAPVVGLTNANAVTAVPATRVNRPPSQTVPLTYSTPFTTQSPPPVQTFALNGS